MKPAAQKQRSKEVHRFLTLVLTFLLCGSPRAEPIYRLDPILTTGGYNFYAADTTSTHMPSPTTARGGGIFDLILILFQVLFQFLGHILQFVVDVIVAIFRFIGDVLLWLWHAVEWVFTAIGDSFRWIGDLFEPRSASRFLETAQDILRNPDQPVQTLDLSALSESQLAFAEEVVAADISVFASFPRNEIQMSEVATDPDNLTSVSAELETTRRILHDTSSVAEIEDAATEQSLLEFLQNDKSPFVAIIGHNEAGMFRLFGGEDQSISLGKMAKLCEAAIKRCLFISCNSRRYISKPKMAAGVFWELSYSQAAEVLQSVSQRLEKRNQASLVDMSEMLLMEEFVLHARPKVEFVVTSGSVGGAVGGAGVAGITYLSPGDTERSNVSRPGQDRSGFPHVGSSNASRATGFPKVTTYESPKTVFGSVFQVKESPQASASTIKTITDTSSIDVAGYHRNSDGIFYITQWSYDRLLRGESANWVLVVR